MRIFRASIAASAIAVLCLLAGASQAVAKSCYKKNSCGGGDHKKACTVIQCIPSCKSGYEEATYGNCSKKKSCYDKNNCGGDGEKACLITQCIPSCEKGLKEFGSGLGDSKCGEDCYDTLNCGDSGEKACLVTKCVPSCKKGLKEFGSGLGDSVCGTDCYDSRNCGAKGEKPCLITDCVPSCSSNKLFEDFGKNKCLELPPGQTPFTASLNSVADEIKKAGGKCEAFLSGFDIPPSPVLTKEAAFSGNCSKYAGSGFACGIMPYTATFISAISGATNIAKDFARDVEKEYDSKDCKKCKDPVCRSGCALVNGLATGAERSYVCVEKIVARMKAEGGKGDLTKPVCTFVGEFGFSYVADTLAIGAAIPPEEKMKRRLANLVTKLEAVLSLAENQKRKYNDIPECAGMF